MSRFVVRFMKDVLGENGRQAEICQSIVEVDAASEGHATELAKQEILRNPVALRLVAACGSDSGQAD